MFFGFLTREAKQTEIDIRCNEHMLIITRILDYSGEIGLSQEQKESLMKIVLDRNSEILSEEKE